MYDPPAVLERTLKAFPHCVLATQQLQTGKHVSHHYTKSSSHLDLEPAVGDTDQDVPRAFRNPSGTPRVLII